MATRYLTLSALFFLSSFSASQPSETLASANPPFSFSFDRFEKNHTFDPEIALYGDAEISGSMVRLTRPVVSSSGRIMYRKPIRFLGTNPGFSTYFSFSISPGEGYSPGLAFLLAPSSDGRHQFRLPPCILSVKYVTLRGANQIEINLGSEISIRSRDLSSIDLGLNSGEKLHSWIDYDGEAERVEVRLSKTQYPRPVNYSISYPIDLSGMLWREAMLVGISASSGNSTQTGRVYSWNFALKHGAPYLMHSEPLDPRSFLVKPREGPPIHLTRAYSWRILMALVFGAACGLLVASAVLFVFYVMFDRSPVAPVEDPAHSIECGDEKVVLVGDKGANSSGK